MGWVVLGCALGGMARFWVSGRVGRRIGETFPWGTLVVNVSGAFAIGLVAAVAASGDPRFTHPRFWHLSVIGFLGTYTTVSSFSLQTLALLRDGERKQAAVNLLLSVGLCLPAVAFGLAAGVVLAGGR